MDHAQSYLKRDRALLRALARALAAGPFLFIRWMFRRYRNWRDALHLEDLPDYLLADIGLSRDEIDRIRTGEVPGRTGWWQP